MELFWDSPRVFTWIKDRNKRYVKCSEGYAQHAGLDGPDAIVGLGDDKMPWHQHAGQILRSDTLAISGLPTTNAVHSVDTAKGRKSILINKTFQDGFLIGSINDITGQVLMEQRGRWDFNKEVFEIGAVRLTRKEVDVVRLLLMGQPVKIIAYELNVHDKTIEKRIESLRKKFNASSKVALVKILHNSGLEYLAHDIDKKMDY